MSFNEEILKQYLNESGAITEIKDELTYIILASLCKIVRQVNDLGRFTEGMLGKLHKEIYDLSFKLKILQENIIQLANVIHKIPNDMLSMQVWKSKKTFSKVTIETQQVYSCTSLPITFFERNNAKIPIPLLSVPEYYENDLEDSNSSNGSFYPCLYCSKLLKNSVSINKGQTSKRKDILNQNINHAGDSKNVLQCQLLKKHIHVGHIPTCGGEEFHSYLDQYDGGSSFYIFPANKNKCQGRSAVNILPGEQQKLHYSIGHMSNPRPRVLYGTGKGDVVLSQRRRPALTHYKSNVFVNPLAPEAPPLPSDWIIQLLSSKRPSACRVLSSRRSRGTSSLFVLGKTTTLPSACLKSNPNIDLTMPPEVKFTATSESLECYELHHSFSVPASLSPKPQISLNLLPKGSVSQLKLIEAQARLPTTHSKEHLHPPQAKLSSFTSTRVSSLHSPLSSTRSISSHGALGIRHYTIGSACATIMQNSSILPIMTKARKALMEAIRKGIKLRKTRGRAESEDPENETERIRVRRKAMGYHSGKSDTETD
ncbi:actin-binding protein WASF1-like [Arvicanthis niloticus]|uniref:actin-binding protein WASF1-like n=1 Tax=Arvicanthis niloticus TaxID=61156 RepID=UPI0014870420|nr:wiskott-Aldrich syndrome protein family member 1-like [Arvicanthis niloticus]